MTKSYLGAGTLLFIIPEGHLIFEANQQRPIAQTKECLIIEWIPDSLLSNFIITDRLQSEVLALSDEKIRTEVCFFQWKFWVYRQLGVVFRWFFFALIEHNSAQLMIYVLVLVCFV